MTMSDLGFEITIKYKCSNMIDEESFIKEFNSDPIKTYKTISDDYTDSVLNFSDDEGEITNIKIYKMNKTNLYYVVEKELEESVDGVYFDGNKTIRVYDIDTQSMNLIIFCEIETFNFKNSESEIQHWCDNNGYEDEEFNFIEL